jgi:hypothetical protein
MLSSDLERVRVDQPIALSAIATSRLNHEVSRFQSQVVRMSREIATGERVDAVSERHVQDAVESLTVRHRARIQSICGTIGGAALGIGATLALQLFHGPLTAGETLLSIVACSIGAVMITLQWKLDS